MKPGDGWSLRRRLLAWLVVPMLLLCGFLLVQAYFSARAAADRAYDRLLQASALAIAERVTVIRGVVSVDLPYAALEMLASTTQDRVFYRITDPQGDFVTGYHDLPVTDAALLDPATPSFHNQRYHDEAIRMVSLAKPVIGGRVLVEVAQTRDERYLLTQALAFSTAWRLLLLVAVAGGLMWWGVQRNLAPLAALRRELRKRSARDLHPLQSPAPREIGPLVAAINQLMARLEHSLGGMQRFIADAAHQLRTPLAVVHTQAELALREQPTTGGSALQDLLASTRRTTRLANQLLDHARASSDISTLDLRPVDLASLAAEATAELVPLALRRDMDLGLESESPAWVEGDAVLLRELLKNLIDNAIRYCPPGARITVRVQAPATSDPRSRQIHLEVEDNGPGIAPAERERVFDRFYRGASASHGEGSGLGLAIVREIVQAHGGQISLSSGGDDQGLLVRIGLPAPGGLDHRSVHTSP